MSLDLKSKRIGLAWFEFNFDIKQITLKVLQKIVTIANRNVFPGDFLAV